MADAPKKPADATAKPAEAPKGGGALDEAANPENAAKARISQLKTELESLRKEVRIMEGRIANRSRISPQALQKENQELKTKLMELRKAARSLTTVETLPRNDEMARQRLQAVRDGTVEFCQRENINADACKSLES